MDTQYVVGLIVVGVIVLLWLANRVNAKHEQKQEELGATPDARVGSAWDSFGGSSDVERLQQRLQKLLRKVDLGDLESKESLVRLTLMCIRAENYESLPSIAARAKELDAACGEAMAMEGLAEAYGGDAEKAADALDRARDGLAACAACAGFDDSKVLLREVLIAIDALESGETDLRRAQEPAAGELDRSKRSAEVFAQLAARAREGASHAREGDSDLAPADDGLVRADAWVDRETSSADAWAAKGFALLRLGKTDIAEGAFDRAVSLDRDCWPALAGLAIVFWDRESESLRRLDALGELGARDEHLDPLLADFVENWHALTERERGILRASARGLGEAFDKLVDGGARLRVLPIHLGARDAEIAANGMGDTIYFDANTYDSAGVFASTRRAALRWDALCDASDRSQWFAARVLALMSASHLDAKTRERLTAGEKGLDGRVLARRFAVEHGDRVKAEVLAKVAPVRPAETAPSTKPDVESAQPAAP